MHEHRWAQNGGGGSEPFLLISIEFKICRWGVLRKIEIWWVGGLAKIFLPGSQYTFKRNSPGIALSSSLVLSKVDKFLDLLNEMFKLQVINT